MQIYYPEKAALIKNFNQEVLWEHLLFVVAFFFSGRFYLSEETRRYLTGSSERMTSVAKKVLTVSRAGSAVNMQLCVIILFATRRFSFVGVFFWKHIWLLFIAPLIVESLGNCE